jgi:stage III sporulation protein SpoIIIAA
LNRKEEDEEKLLEQNRKLQVWTVSVAKDAFSTQESMALLLLLYTWLSSYVISTPQSSSFTILLNHAQ